jgi:threonine/homoserine/homoserine lactone efflux protein
VPLQLLTLGGIFAVVAILSDSMWAIAAGSARAWLARSRGPMEAFAAAGGLVLIGLGLRLAVTGRSD